MIVTTKDDKKKFEERLESLKQFTFAYNESLVNMLFL